MNTELSFFIVLLLFDKNFYDKLLFFSRTMLHISKNMRAFSSPKLELESDFSLARIPSCYNWTRTSVTKSINRTNLILRSPLLPYREPLWFSTGGLLSPATSYWLIGLPITETIWKVSGPCSALVSGGGVKVWGDSIGLYILPSTTN